MRSLAWPHFLILLSLGMTAGGMVQPVWCQTDTSQTALEVVMTEVRSKVMDLDDDGYQDTLIMRERRWLYDSTIRRRRQIPLRILWGADTSLRKVIYDTTVLTLPFPEDTRVGASYYDADNDGYRDIVVSWWWTDTTSRKTKDRVLAFRGGADLRAEKHLVMSSRTAVPEKDFVIRLDESDSTQGQRVSHGGLLVRERPMVPATRPKQPRPEERSTELIVPALRLFPNPASAVMNLTIRGVDDLKVLNAEILLVDAKGSVMLRRTALLGEVATGVPVDVSQLSQGAYIVAVTVDGATLAESSCVIQR